MPIATALLGIGSGLSLIALLGHIFPAPSFSPIVAALIGLGVGVDYALFVTRFRTELHEGARAEEAVVAALTLLPALLGFTGYRLAKPSRLNTFIGGKVSG